MSIQVRGAIAAVAVAHLEIGQFFVLPEGQGRLFCIRGLVRDRDVVAILGSQDSNWDEHGAGWMDLSAVYSEIAYPLPGVYIEPEPSDLGFPVTEERLYNGALVIAEDGDALIYASQPRRMMFDLQTGRGEATPPIAYRYNRWSLKWRADHWREGTPDAVLFTHTPRE